MKQDSISSVQNNLLNGIVGDKSALQLEEIIRNQYLYHDNTFSAIIGIGAILLAATGMFNQIQRSINAIWGLNAKSSLGILNSLIRYLVSLVFVNIVEFIFFFPDQLTLHSSF